MEKNNVYRMVADRIVEELNKGIIPWQRPWTGSRAGAINYVSRKPYSLLNQMLLDEAGEFVTFKQVQELGGSIRKGEKSRMVVFFKQYRYEETKDDGTKEQKSVPLLRYYNVWHISQCEGIESKLDVQEVQTLHTIDEQERVIEDYVKRTGLHFSRHESNKAYYSPAEDRVVVPDIDQYSDIAEYYSTTYHELTHSTGHPDRLNRKGITDKAAFGSDTYSREELVAEMGAAMLCNDMGVDISKAFRNSVAYIQGWSQHIMNEPRLFVSAACKAEQAVRYILNETADAE